MRYTILIADDEQDIIEMLSLYMDSNDFLILKANDGEAALDLLKNNKVDIALVDIMMPKMNGYEFIRNARKEYNLPVIILSAKNDDTDKVMGLNIGADAYITKPFNPFEVIAYLKAMLRRYYELGSGKSSLVTSEILTVGELELEMESFTLKKNGKILVLTSSELKIIALLMRSPGRVYTKSQIYECINGEYYEGDDNTIMVHISNLRAKIENDQSNPKYIKTIRGLGYKIENV